MAEKGHDVGVLWKLMQLMEGDDIVSSLSDALEALIQAVSAGTGVIWLKNRDTEHIYSVISVGVDSVAGFSIEYGQGIVGECCESTEPIDVKDAGQDSRFPAGKDEITGIEMKNAFFMPMIFLQKN